MEQMYPVLAVEGEEIRETGVASARPIIEA
jgi:hypothetical protein